jgi:hypothetical protein
MHDVAVVITDTDEWHALGTALAWENKLQRSVRGRLRGEATDDVGIERDVEVLEVVPCVYESQGLNFPVA